MFLAVVAKTILLWSLRRLFVVLLNCIAVYRKVLLIFCPPHLYPWQSNNTNTSPNIVLHSSAPSQIVICNTSQKPFYKNWTQVSWIYSRTVLVYQVNSQLSRHGSTSCAEDSDVVHTRCLVYGLSRMFSWVDLVGCWQEGGSASCHFNTCGPCAVWHYVTKEACLKCTEWICLYCISSDRRTGWGSDVLTTTDRWTDGRTDWAHL